VSEAARALIAQRWGAQRPARMARELAKRAAEVPEPERSELLDALQHQQANHTPSGHAA
jgi:hypothetical protein